MGEAEGERQGQEAEPASIKKRMDTCRESRKSIVPRRHLDSGPSLTAHSMLQVRFRSVRAAHACDNVSCNVASRRGASSHQLRRLWTLSVLLFCTIQLNAYQLFVGAAWNCKQLIVRSLLGDNSIFHHADFVCLLHCRQAVRDDDDRH